MKYNFIVFKRPTLAKTQVITKNMNKGYIDMSHTNKVTTNIDFQELKNIHNCTNFTKIKDHPYKSEIQKSRKISNVVRLKY